MKERIILAVDTSEETEAERLVDTAASAGATYVKLGLELATATSWRYCSELAASRGVQWVADAKLDDIPNTVAGAIRNLCRLEHPPAAVTMHATAGLEAMRWARREADEAVKLLGVTILTSMDYEEVWRVYRAPVEDRVSELARMAVEAGIWGVVASPREVRRIKENPATKDLFTMIPGTRSAAAASADQARTATPFQAVRDGADLLVIGRQVTKAEDPAAAYEALKAEISAAGGLSNA